MIKYLRFEFGSNMDISNIFRFARAQLFDYIALLFFRLFCHFDHDYSIADVKTHWHDLQPR